MIDFEQWYEQEIGSENKPEYEAAKWAWDFQQSKIDEINEVANGWKDEYRIMTLRYERSKKRIDELRNKLDCCREENEALLDKLNVPDGYKLVPVEPSEEMYVRQILEVLNDENLFYENKCDTIKDILK